MSMHVLIWFLSSPSRTPDLMLCGCPPPLQRPQTDVSTATDPPPSHFSFYMSTQQPPLSAAFANGEAGRFVSTLECRSSSWM